MVSTHSLHQIIHLVSLLDWSESNRGKQACGNQKLSALEGHSEVLIAMTAVEVGVCL